MLAVLAALNVPRVAKVDAQTPATSGTESSLPAAQVTGEAARTDLEHRVDAFVRAVTRSSGLADEDPLVRWNAPICFLVAGLGAEDLKVVSSRLSQIGSLAGAPVARSPCQPNFIVVATSEPERVLVAWYARDSHLFGDAPPAHIRQFFADSQSRPVLVWYNVDSGRKAGMRNGHFVPSDTQGDSSSFNAHAVLGFSSIVAIIDTQRTAHATPDQLAAYVAMTGLTQVDLGADLGSAPSILRLFAAPAENQPADLSTWDTAFLRALYRSNPTSRTQRFEIAERVAHDLSR